MKHTRISTGRFALTGLAALAILTSACSEKTSTEAQPPAVVEPIDDERARVEFTEKAMDRTGVEFSEVSTTTVEGVERLSVPYSAVIYHFDGTAWTYTNPEPRVFVREAVDVLEVNGDTAVLNSGPAPGTSVASVGAAEIYGTEFGVGK